ncbi:hypothetical protein D0809_13505 [Flavobacterium circumlabens]|uniref:Uncharacterized protein n=1 Tax=Flavobacterium circumlabens TaxID=2133765 RepID=A0A4Y7UBR9_9FLAO|nr:hypothetical protein [Flavobacterium circumlabens]TCN57595.1 hypothetical protein EV142_104255 [Flavobacterium circumlabens]TEB43903.1 hypothetical protein D0809_13505 [Flavobacterium circumlabens]
MRIYKYIYYFFYIKSSKKNAVPEIPVYTMLSFIQTSNLITITNIIMLITRLNINYDVRKIALVAPILLYFLNYYFFTKKGNGGIIIKDETYSLGKYSFLLDVFGFGSFPLAVLTYYFYREF